MLASPTASSTKHGLICNKSSRAILVVICLLLTLLAMILCLIGIFDPEWWYVDITEYRQDWKIGLWLYCRRGGTNDEVGESADLYSWICDTRHTFPNQQKPGLSSPMMDANHNEYVVLTSLGSSVYYVCIMQDIEARRFTSFEGVYYAVFSLAGYCSIIGGVVFLLNLIASIPLIALSFKYHRQKCEEMRRCNINNYPTPAIKTTATPSYTPA
ncbi:unnamed protein product [Sphagnum balticum]